MDPLTTSDGKPYGPKRYKQIIKEIYYVTKAINTSYGDVLAMSPLERGYVLEFLVEETEKKEKLFEQQQKELEEKRKQRGGK